MIAAEQDSAGVRSTRVDLPMMGRIQRGGGNGKATVRAGLCVRIGCDTDIVTARQQGRALARSMDFSPTDAAFIATTISELARLLLAHTAQGEIRVHRLDDRLRAGVTIVARDPIVRDYPLASPLQASDLSLPDIGRLVDEFEIALEADGTTIRATKWRRP